jgi:hypothetical protein
MLCLFELCDHYYVGEAQHFFGRIVALLRIEEPGEDILLGKSVT